ncbi:MAG: sulfotransferase family protein [Alphaproteobacteria bacterium]|nr:sulfotransferase family protein [Alphaproteobacteria bacterium]
MIILWNEKLAFIAVPKTGTTAIEAALAPYASISFGRQPSLKHMTHQRFNRFIRPYLNKEGQDDVEVFAVMREPISWLGSWYRYRQRDELVDTVNSTRGISFDQFVQAYLQPKNRPAYAQLGSQSRLLSISRHEVGIRLLFRYENMSRLLDFLSDRLGARINLGEYNVSPKMNLELTAVTEKQLRRQYALDFETYAAIAD